MSQVSGTWIHRDFRTSHTADVDRDRRKGIFFLGGGGGEDTYALPGKTYEAYKWKRVFYYQHSSRLRGGMCWTVGTRMEGHVIKRLSIVSAHVAVSTQKLSKRQLMKAVFL